MTPDGFEIYMVDLATSITWNSEFVGDLSIFYKAAEGSEWILIEEGVSADAGSYEWLPEVPSDWCKIKVIETEYPDVADESGFRFFVYQLDMISPQGGEDLDGTTSFDIEWEGEIIPNVKIEFSSDDGDTWEVIEANASVDDSPYAWTVPNINSEDCFIKLSVPNAAELFKINPTDFAIHEALGLDELTDSEMKISAYPNPVKDFVSIQLQMMNRENEEITLDIFNSNGQLVLTQKLPNEPLNKEQVIIDTQEFPQGVYFINVNIAGKDRSIKFIKM